MDISYDYYRVFYCVAQCRSFTRAAEALQQSRAATADVSTNALPASV